MFLIVLKKEVVCQIGVNVINTDKPILAQCEARPFSGTLLFIVVEE